MPVFPNRVPDLQHVGLQSNVISIMAIGANLTKQPYDALIGRDILKLCTLIYNGWDNSYQLHI